MKLTVIEKLHSRHTPSGQIRTVVKVLCDCGNERIVYYSNLRSGQTRSCGCLWSNPEWKNPDFVKKWMRDYYIQNRKEIIRNNVARGAAYKKKKKSIDPAYKLQCLLRSRLNSALKKKSKYGSSVKLLGCTTEEAIRYIEKKFLPGMTWENWTHGGWHLDHIIPLSFFDLTDTSQLSKACHYTNLQPLWAVDNLKKGGVRSLKNKNAKTC